MSTKRDKTENDNPTKRQRREEKEVDAGAAPDTAIADTNLVLQPILESTSAYSHDKDAGFSLFLAQRTKRIHFVRHGEGTHNVANAAAGNDTPVTVGTPGAEQYRDAPLTLRGRQQCLEAKKEYGSDMNPQLIVVSPFTRTLQTAHMVFAGRRIPFLIHDGCRERSGKYFCDQRRSKDDILKEIEPLYQATDDILDATSYGYPNEQDLHWTPERESSESVIARCVKFIQWIATRPETELAVVTHSSWLKHLFRNFDHTASHEKDTERMHRLSGNAEVRSITLALHRGFYPEGTWLDGTDDSFVPSCPSFRRFKWAPNDAQLLKLHAGENVKEVEVEATSGAGIVLVQAHSGGWTGCINSA